MLTHGLSYGADCTSLKTFVSESGTNDTKAIGVIDPSTVTFDELTAMHAAGVRGIRVNLYKYQATHDVGLQETALCEHALAIRKHDNAQNWSMAFTHTHPRVLERAGTRCRRATSTRGHPTGYGSFCIAQGG